MSRWFSLSSVTLRTLVLSASSHVVSGWFMEPSRTLLSAGSHVVSGWFMEPSRTLLSASSHVVSGWFMEPSRTLLSASCHVVSGWSMEPSRTLLSAGSHVYILRGCFMQLFYTDSGMHDVFCFEQIIWIIKNIDSEMFFYQSAIIFK